MLDDLGTKLDLHLIERLPPTVLVETSPGNFQAWYKLSESCRDGELFNRVGESFVRVHHGGIDPGMRGTSRIGRVPGSVNGKAKYGGSYPVTLASWHPDRQYAIEEIAAAFGLDLTPPRWSRAGGLYLSGADLPMDVIRMRAEMFEAFLRWMDQHGMVKGLPNAAGWIPITCPWVGYHTNAADNGSAIRLPHEDNQFYGAFRCHHSTACTGRGWHQLTEWINQQANEGGGNGSWDYGI